MMSSGLGEKYVTPEPPRSGQSQDFTSPSLNERWHLSAATDRARASQWCHNGIFLFDSFSLAAGLHGGPRHIPWQRVGLAVGNPV